jgi:predicted DsbA family dithiol-disulfide isomerase
MAIEVVSDVVCPWCFIGKRRLEKALSLVGGQELRVQWKAFQLNPHAPKEGLNRQEYRARKFGSLGYAQQLEVHVVDAGAEEGIAFRFDRIERVPNTLDAHRLVWLAGCGGEQNALVENLFQAYFLEGEDIGRPEVLKRIAIRSGLDSGRVDELLQSDLERSEVQAEEREAHSRGVNGVPAFFVGGTPVASGAQKPELLASLLAPALENGGCA